MSEDTNINGGLESSIPPADPPFNPVGELVRFAESLMDQGDYASAISCLQEAQGRQPENQYILAVMGRAEGLRNGAVSPHGPTGVKALGITIGTHHTEGMSNEPPESSHDIDARVRRLTIVAARLFDRGAFDTAFDSLMKAYLLDPSSSIVLECERRFMPVWDLLKNRGVATSSPDKKREADTEGPSMHPRVPRTERPPSPPGDTQATPQADQQKSRLRELQQQQDEQRRKHEQTIWRNASQPPKIHGKAITTKDEGSPEKPTATVLPAAAPQLRDLSKYESISLLKWLKGK